MITRRRFISTAAIAASLATLARRPALASAERLALGEPHEFSFDRLREEARALAASPFAPAPGAAALEKIDYDVHGQIRFKPELALFADGPGQFPVTFFHLGRFFRTPVRMYVVEAGRPLAREIVYNKEYFSIPSGSPAHDAPDNAGFAGFRLQESRLGDKTDPDWRTHDWVAFLGASYFRAIGQLHQYGLSARGIAINSAIPDKPEEFPAFTRAYIQTPEPGSTTVTVYALLDSESLCGAYKFSMRRGAGVIMDVEKTLFLRKDIERFGVSALTSMYWFSEKTRPSANDWRPEVHDSDGLALLTQAGEHIWRPLNNPPHAALSSFADENPRGFGLAQRDRNIDHYLDGVHYERRPSLWVEPKGNWGKGAIQLIELPTSNETQDNIVAMWVPESPAKSGDEYTFQYRLHWLADEPFASPLARCIATRTGAGGQPGQERPHGARKFVVEFLGGELGTLPFGVKPEADLWSSRGKFSDVFTEAVPNNVPGHWRVQFDLAVEGSEPVEMRLVLRTKEKLLSETWAYQHQPA